MAEPLILRETRERLLQIALELEAAAAGARGAAGQLPDRDRSWPHMQAMYTRLETATHLVETFRRSIDEAVRSGELGPAVQSISK